MHITYESENAFDLWNKTRRVTRNKQEILSAHFNKESNPQKPWVLVATPQKEDWDAI